MSRALRIDVPGGLYHVTSRGLERRAIAAGARDRQRWLDLLDVVSVRRRWRVLASVLMGNHFHLVVETPDADLSAGMHDLNAGYATWFNRRHGRVGPLFQGRFKAILVEHGSHEWELSRYVHLNPVRARLVERPEAYRWGSCRAYLTGGRAPAWLAWEDVLRQHGRTLRAARRAYRRFLAEGLAAGVKSPLAGAVASTLLGSESFVARMRAWLADRLPDRDVPAARALRPAVTLEDVATAVCDVFSVDAARLAEPRRHGDAARAAAVYLSRKLAGASGVAVGARFGGVTGAAVSQTVARTTLRLRADRAFAALVRNCEARLAKT